MDNLKEEIKKQLQFASNIIVGEFKIIKGLSNYNDLINAKKYFNNCVEYNRLFFDDSINELESKKFAWIKFNSNYMVLRMDKLLEEIKDKKQIKKEGFSEEYKLACFIFETIKIDGKEFVKPELNEKIIKTRLNILCVQNNAHKAYKYRTIGKNEKGERIGGYFTRIKTIWD